MFLSLLMQSLCPLSYYTNIFAMAKTQHCGASFKQERINQLSLPVTVFVKEKTC